MRRDSDYDRFEGREFSYPEPVPDEVVDRRIDDMKIEEGAASRPTVTARRTLKTATQEWINLDRGNDWLGELQILGSLTPLLAEEIARALKALTKEGEHHADH